MVSYLKDADAIIFSTFDDDAFYNMSLVSDYCNNVSKQYIVWYYKVKQLHESFPITNIGLEYKYYKNLYFYLLCQKYSPIVRWAVILYEGCYEKIINHQKEGYEIGHGFHDRRYGIIRTLDIIDV
jgi:hypothetical protein